MLGLGLSQVPTLAICMELRCQVCRQHIVIEGEEVTRRALFGAVPDNCCPKCGNTLGDNWKKDRNLKARIKRWIVKNTLKVWDGKVDAATLDYEVWTPASRCSSNYMVSNMGRVVRITGGRGTNLKNKKFAYTALTEHSKGYLKVDLWKDGERKTVLMQVLVQESFRGPAPKDEYGWHEVHHINANKQDNRLENLEYRTSQKNNEEKWHRYYTEGENVTW